MSALLFILGLAIALGGHYPVKWFLSWVRRISEKTSYKEAVPGWVVGTFERVLAFTLFLFNLESAYTILIAWMAAKLAANWQRRPLPDGDEEASRQIRAGNFIALMAGVLSLSFGVLGGVIARCALK